MIPALLTGLGVAWLVFLWLTRPRGFRPAAQLAPVGARARTRTLRWADRRQIAAWAGGGAGALLVWLGTGNPVAALILGAAGATLPAALAEMTTARARDRRERQICEFAAACADALSVEPAAPQALAEAGREAAPWLSAEVDAALGQLATGAGWAEALRQRAGACGRRDLALLLRLLAALGERGAAGGEAVARLAAILRRRRELRAERRAELAGHSAFAGILFLLPPVAYLSLVSLWPTAAQVLRHTLVGQVAVAFAATSEAGAWLALRKAARWVE